MMLSKPFELAFQEHQRVLNDSFALIPQLDNITQKVIDLVKKGGTVFWLGNGGSAADAQHLAAELVGRFKLERRAIPSLSLSTDTSVLTCLSNDYDYSMIFARQLEALCRPGDVVIGISTSGNSQNIIKGIQKAKAIGAYTIGFLGNQGGALRDLVEDALIVPSQVTARIQEIHILMGHILCEQVELAMLNA